MTNVDRIGAAELHAYVDGQLDVTGRLEVEDYLASHPELAARVMADLRTRDALRLAFPTSEAPHRLDNLAAARKLEKALSFGRIAAPLRRIAAGIAIFALGWGAAMGWTEMTHRAREPAVASTVSLSPAGVTFDPVKLGTALNVKLPRVPKGWKVAAAEVVRTSDGPGVHLTFDTPEFGRLSLIASNTKNVGIVLPTIAKGEHDSTAHWQLVSDSYELTADLPRKPLEFAALELFQTLY